MMGVHWQERIKPLLDKCGLTLDELTDAIPLNHYGPGGCNGVDLEETYEQVLAVIARVLDKRATDVRAE